MSRPSTAVRQAFSFLTVGVSSTGVYFLLLYALRSWIESTMQLTACCYGISMVYNFALQNWVTFQAGRPTPRTISRYAAMHATAMGLNSLLMAGLVDRLNTPLFSAQVVVTTFISAMIFVVSKQWVYRR